MRRLVAAIMAAVVLLCADSCAAHDWRVDVPQPESVGEAWNLLGESSANVTKLIEGNQLSDVPVQVTNCKAALRVLKAHAGEFPGKEKLVETTEGMSEAASLAADACHAQENAVATSQAKWGEYRKLLTELESHYPPEVVKSAVYICPMHPFDRHLKAEERCSECRMALVRRHIPASAVWEKPGETSLMMTVLSPPLEVGRQAEVRIKFSRRDGAPVASADLVEMRTQKFHLLINDESLSDYHHEHPTPMRTPGEYRFDFMPARPGPYRVWADVVPAATGVQEYVIADIPAKTPAAKMDDRRTVLSAVVEGRRYELHLADGGEPIRAGHTISGTIHVTGPDGKPFRKLEPIMGRMRISWDFARIGRR